MRNRRNDAFKLKTFRWSLAQNSDPPQRNARHASRPKVKTGRLSGGGEHFAVALYHSDDSRNPRGGEYSRVRPMPSEAHGPPPQINDLANDLQQEELPAISKNCVRSPPQNQSTAVLHVVRLSC